MVQNLSPADRHSHRQTHIHQLPQARCQARLVVRNRVSQTDTQTDTHTPTATGKVSGQAGGSKQSLADRHSHRQTHIHQLPQARCQTRLVVGKNQHDKQTQTYTNSLPPQTRRCRPRFVVNNVDRQTERTPIQQLPTATDKEVSAQVRG